MRVALLAVLATAATGFAQDEGAADEFAAPAAAAGKKDKK